MVWNSGEGGFEEQRNALQCTLANEEHTYHEMDHSLKYECTHLSRRS